MDIECVGATTQDKQTVSASGNMGEVLFVRLPIMRSTTIKLPIVVQRK
jgi:hypothetical protein